MVYLILLLILAGWYLFSFARRKPRSGPSPELGIVIGLLDDISYDLDLVEKRMNDAQMKKKFKASSWKANRNKLGFLQSGLESNIKEAFSLIAGMNARTEAAKKKDDPTPFSSEELNTLGVCLSDISAVLVDWLKNTLDNTDHHRRQRFGEP